MIAVFLLHSKADFITRVQQPDGHLRDTRLERLPGHGRRGPQGRSVVPGLRIVAAQSDVPPDPLHALLQPVAQLGRDPLRRGPRCQRLPKEHLRHGRRVAVHHGRRPDHLRRDGTRHGLQLLRHPELGVLGTPFTSPTYWFPYPGMLAAMFFSNGLIQVVLLLLLSLWFFGWAGSVFLSSTRMIFAAAFDRVLPEWAAKVDDRTHVPIGALALMLLPSIPISYLYAYNSQFYSYTLDATVVIAITYFGTTLGGDRPAVAEARDLPGVADLEVRGGRDSARHARGRHLRRLPRLLHLQVVHGRRLRRQPLAVAQVHARPLRDRDRHLRVLAGRCGAGRAST